MISRERILKALNHQETDRIPRDLGGTESTGMTANSLFKLCSHLHIPATLKIFEPYQYVAYIMDELKEKFKVDTVNLTLEPENWVKRVNPFNFEVLLPKEWYEETCKDESSVVKSIDGKVIARRPKGGYYFDPVNPPLETITEPGLLAKHKETIFSFDLPSFADEPIEHFQSRAEVLYDRGECTVFNLCCHILAAGQLLRGYENFMVDLLINKKMVRNLLDYLIEGYCRRIDWLVPFLKDKVDVILLNDDLGTQNGPMLSPSTYREMIKPYQERLFKYVKKSFNKPILFHSCGAVREFIPDLIEVGVDALNPVQLSAAGMELEGLKRDFGNDITFWGGGIDTQEVLNRKTPAEVKDAVKKNVDILAPGGGFVFCQVHNVQPDVPPENVLAMYEALDEVSGY